MWHRGLWQPEAMSPMGSPGLSIDKNRDTVNAAAAAQARRICKSCQLA